MKSVLILFISFALLFSCKKTGENACNGNTRREVKLMIDDLASDVDTVIIETTIKALGELTVPEVKSETGRQDVEKHIYTVTGTVEKLKRYRDGDYHIRLEDEEGNFLITEVPNPDCKFVVDSKYAKTYRELVAYIEANVSEGETITVTGVSFVDIDHVYKRKQAENNLELHPVLQISM